MKRAHPHAVLGAALMAASSVPWLGAHGSAVSAPEPAWELLVPAGRLGRFGLRVERAEFMGPVSQAAARITEAWGQEPWLVLGGGDEAAPRLSRLGPDGIETVTLRTGANGRVEARRSMIEWRASSPGGLPTRSEPAFVAALGALGEPLPGFASVDRGVENLTRVWWIPGDIGAISSRVARLAAVRGLSPLIRFEAPADAPESLRGGRVLAFGGAGVVAVVTFARHAGGVAVVVHYQERRP